MSGYEFRDVPEQDIASIKISSSTDEIGEHMSQAFPKIFEAVTKAGATPAGPPLSRYFAFGGPVIEYECAVPVQAPFPGEGDVQPGKLGGGEAAVAIHMGSYDTIGETWESLMTWVREQGREPAGPGWEYYLTDPSAEPEPSKWVTEVYMPVSPAAVPAS